MKNAMRLAVIAILAVSGRAEAACEACDWDDILAPYTNRIDGATPSSGNAKAVNTVTHMITPWPPYVFNRRIPANGVRMVDAIKNYQDGLKPDKGSTTPSMPQSLASGVAAGIAGGMAAGGGGAAAGGGAQTQGAAAGGQGGQTGR
jgi:hypothetical protein